MTRTQVLMLGSGTPNAEPGRVSSGLAIVVDEQPYLVDCGHSVVQRVVEAHGAGMIPWSTRDLTRLFVTHLHADHTVGLPDLLFTPWIHGRECPILAYGPSGFQQMTDHILMAYDDNIQEHLRAHPASAEGYQVRVETVEVGHIYEDERVSVYAMAANHGEWQAYSFKFVTADRTVVVSGDTKPVAGFVEWARDCDVLIHEVYSSRRFVRLPPAWQMYHAAVHTSSRELAELASEMRPGLLVLYHQLFWDVSPSDLVAEIREGYDGRVVSANDLDLY